MIHFSNGIDDHGHTQLLARAFGVNFEDTTPAEQLAELRQNILKHIKNRCLSQLRREQADPNVTITGE